MTCEWCGDPIEVRPVIGSNRRRFCNDRCRALAHWYRDDLTPAEIDRRFEAAKRIVQRRRSVSRETP